MIAGFELGRGRGGPAQRDAQEMADASSAPVTNALTDDHHPCQALADLLTLRERFGGLEGLTVAYAGDGNNVAHSLIEAAALGARAVYTDVWVSTGDEAERARRISDLAAYRVDRDLMSLAADDAVLLHEQAALYALATGWEG